MKKTILLLLGLILLTGISYAQNGTMAIRAGGSLIPGYWIPGFVCAFDLKIPKTPVVLSPFFQFYTRSGEGTEQYFGADIQIAKRLSKGFYFGVGGGIATWSYKGYFDRYSRNSPFISPLLGIRIKIANNLNFFTEGKLFINTQSNQDTKAWNRGQRINGPSFHNDITFTVGLGFLLK